MKNMQIYKFQSTGAIKKKELPNFQLFEPTMSRNGVGYESLKVRQGQQLGWMCLTLTVHMDLLKYDVW